MLHWVLHSFIQYVSTSIYSNYRLFALISHIMKILKSGVGSTKTSRERLTQPAGQRGLCHHRPTLASSFSPEQKWKNGKNHVLGFPARSLHFYRSTQLKVPLSARIFRWLSGHKLMDKWLGTQIRWSTLCGQDQGDRLGPHKLSNLCSKMFYQSVVGWHNRLTEQPSWLSAGVVLIRKACCVTLSSLRGRCWNAREDASLSTC